MTPSPFALGITLAASIIAIHCAHAATDSLQSTLANPARAINGIAPTTRSHWMRRANEALADVLGTPCPFAAFGTVIVNHTGHGLGDLVCIGANTNPETGNPTLHGEIAAIQNCTRILTDPTGPYNLTAAESLLAFSQLSLYTNAESCPMCASAIRWAGFKEYIYGTSINRLVEQGWAQIRISSMEVFRQSFDLDSTTTLMGEVLTNETDPYFLWQFDPEHKCPSTCVRRNGLEHGSYEPAAYGNAENHPMLIDPVVPTPKDPKVAFERYQVISSTASINFLGSGPKPEYVQATVHPEPVFSALAGRTTWHSPKPLKRQRK